MLVVFFDHIVPQSLGHNIIWKRTLQIGMEAFKTPVANLLRDCQDRKFGLCGKEA